MSNVDKFYTLYEKLYNDKELENNYQDLVVYFDYLLSHDKGFCEEASKFNKQRKDIMTSDREALAYMLMKLGVNLENKSITIED